MSVKHYNKELHRSKEAHTRNERLWTKNWRSTREASMSVKGSEHCNKEWTSCNLSALLCSCQNPEACISSCITIPLKVLKYSELVFKVKFSILAGKKAWVHQSICRSGVMRALHVQRIRKSYQQQKICSQFAKKWRNMKKYNMCKEEIPWADSALQREI